MFKTTSLYMTIHAGLCIVNFLVVQFNLNNCTYQPYRKPDNTLLNINKKSNHPAVVLKQLPKSIAKQIFDISFGENFFLNSTLTYSEALTKSGFNVALAYNKKQLTVATQKRKNAKDKLYGSIHHFH